MDENKRFDAPAHMRKIRTRQGMQDYLDVKWRIAWLRAEHPEAQIVTEQIEGDADHARFKCTITIPALWDQERGHVNAAAIGTGHGSETAQDFPDFYEKAETKAIGRACATLGYGTDAATDFDDGEPLDGRGAAKDERATRNHEEGARPTSQKPEGGYPHAHWWEEVKREAKRTGTAIEEGVDGNGMALAIRANKGQVDWAENATSADKRAAILAALKAMPDATPEAQPSPPARLTAVREEVAPDVANLHQLAQLNALAAAGYDLAAKLATLGLEHPQGLTREQAKELIVEGRASVRGATATA